VQGAVPLRGKETGSGGILYSARPTSIVSTPCGLLTVLVLRQLQGRRVGRTEQTTCGIARCFVRRVGSTEQTTCGIARCFVRRVGSTEQTTRGIARCFVRRVGSTEQTTCGIARCFGSTEQTTRGIARCFESQKQSVEFCIGTAVLVMDECLNKQHRPLLKLSSGNECGAVVEWY